MTSKYRPLRVYIKVALLYIVAILIAVSSSTSVFALSKEQQLLNKKEINYYDLEQSCSLASEETSSGTGPADGLAYPNLPDQAMSDAIKQYIREKAPRSPFLPLTDKIVASSKEANVNPFMIPIIAYRESTLGTNTAGLNLPGAPWYNSFGRTAIPENGHPGLKGPGNPRTWWVWNSVSASIDYSDPYNEPYKEFGGDMSSFLRVRYGDVIDQNDIRKFIERYSPSFDNTQAGNTTEDFIKLMEDGIKDMASKATTLSSGADNEATPPNNPRNDQVSTTGTPSNSVVLGTLPEKSQKVFDAAKPAIEKQRAIYEHGAEVTGIKWEYLAAIHYRESDNTEGTSLLAGEPLGATNPDGITDTGGSDANANAVAAANHFIGMAKSVYNVDVKNPNISFQDLQNAFLAYNRGSMYKLAKNYDPPGREYTADESPYVMAGYSNDYALPMDWPPYGSNSGSFWGEPIRGQESRLGAMSILAGLGITGSSGSDGQTQCPEDGTSVSGTGAGCTVVGQSSNGLVFPLCTTKEAIMKGVDGGIWCYKARSSCHHDYAAADIHDQVDVPVIAARGGVVFKVDTPSVCSGFDAPRVQIKGDDNLYYYYTHMKVGSVTITEGQEIAAGDRVGVIGPTECAQGTAPHLHIHRGSAPTACAGSSGCSQHADYNANDIQKDLYEAYQKIPNN